MNKTDLIKHIASEADLTQHAAARALDAVLGLVTKTLKKGGVVSITGFGRFSVASRAARTGRNPQTGAEIKIKASRAAKFTPGQHLKDAVN